MKIASRVCILASLILLSAYPVHAEPQLAWDASAGVVEGYRIYYGTAKGAYSGAKDVGKVTQYPMSSLLLQEKTTYYLTVKAYNGAGESGPSNEVTWYCPDSTPPVPPQNLSKEITGDGNVLLNWTANTEADLKGYRLYQGTSERVYGPPSFVGKDITFTVSGLTQGTKYYFSLTALDESSNESGYSNEVNATIPDTTAPVIAFTSPTSGTSYETTFSGITLSGTANDNVAVSKVTWNNGSGLSGTATGTAAWSISGLSLLDGTNIITVTASDSAGNSAGKALTVTYTAPKTLTDTTAPTVTITSPATGTSYTAKTPKVKLSGSASDNVGVSKVVWANAANSTSGTASGTTSWATSNIPLITEENLITITAFDAAGNSSKAEISVMRLR